MLKDLPMPSYFVSWHKPWERNY